MAPLNQVASLASRHGPLVHAAFFCFARGCRKLRRADVRGGGKPGDVPQGLESAALPASAAFPVSGIVFTSANTSNRPCGQFACPDEDAFEHELVQAARIGISQGWMVAAEQGQTVWQLELRSVAEGVKRAAQDDLGIDQVGEKAVPSDLAERDDDAETRQVGGFSGEVDGAIPDFLRVWVCRRVVRSGRRRRSRLREGACHRLSKWRWADWRIRWRAGWGT